MYPPQAFLAQRIAIGLYATKRHAGLLKKSNPKPALDSGSHGIPNCPYEYSPGCRKAQLMTTQVCVRGYEHLGEVSWSGPSESREERLNVSSPCGSSNLFEAAPRVVQCNSRLEPVPKVSAWPHQSSASRRMPNIEIPSFALQVTLSLYYTAFSGRNGWACHKAHELKISNLSRVPDGSAIGRGVP